MTQRTPLPKPARPHGRHDPSRRAARQRAGLWFVLPAFLAYLLLAVLPALATVGLSFMTWDGAGRPAFAAFGNYARLLADDAFQAALGRTLALALTGGASAAGGLALALLLWPGARGAEVVRAALVVPALLSPAVVGAIWGGLLGTGSDGAPFPAILLAAAWSSLGLCAVVLLAGLQDVDPERLAAARAEGLPRAQGLRLIALPHAAPHLAMTAAAAAIAALGGFGLPWTMMGGAPDEPAVLATYAVEVALLEGDQGRGAAVGVVLAALALLVGGAALRLRGRLA